MVDDCVPFVTDGFNDADATPLTSHLTDQDSSWGMLNNILSPGFPNENEWQVVGNKLFPQNFIAGGVYDYFNYVDQDITADEYRIELTFEIIDGAVNIDGFVEFILGCDFQTINAGTVSYGYVMAYAQLYTSGADGTTGLLNYVTGPDGVPYNEGNEGDGNVVTGITLTDGTHVMKMTIDKTGAYPIREVFIDDVPLLARTFNPASYVANGGAPMPALQGGAGFGIRHDGNIGSVKVLNFLVTECPP